MWTLYKSVLDSINAIPGVKGSAVSSGLPFGAGNFTRTPTSPVGQSAMPAGAALPVDWREVSPDYFKTMQIPLLRGRVFTDQDNSTAPPVMVLSEITARRFWGDQDAVGHMVHMSNRDWTVIGVVADSRINALNQEPNPTQYMSAAAMLTPLADVVVRTDQAQESVVPMVRQKIKEVDADLPISNVRTMDEWVSLNASQPRLNSILIEAFALIALLIAAVGIYGVLSFSVTQRTREIGVRIAMGAGRGDVLALIVREGMAVAVAGIVAGIGGALAVSKALASLLYGVQPRDLKTFAAGAGMLLVVSAIACYAPALRATRVDPMVALRYE